MTAPAQTHRWKGQEEHTANVEEKKCNFSVLGNENYNQQLQFQLQADKTRTLKEREIMQWLKRKELKRNFCLWLLGIKSIVNLPSLYQQARKLDITWKLCKAGISSDWLGIRALSIWLDFKLSDYTCYSKVQIWPVFGSNWSKIHQENGGSLKIIEIMNYMGKLFDGKEWKFR